MSSSGHTIPNGEAPAGGIPMAPIGGAGNGECPHVFLGDTQGGVACGVCRVTLQLRHRAVRFPCGQGRHVLHARFSVEALARGVAPAPLSCPAVRAQRPRRDALKPAVEADPGLRNRAARMGGGTAGDADLRSRGRWYGRDQNSLGVGHHLTPFHSMTYSNASQQGKSAAVVGRSTRAQRRPCAGRTQPRHGRAPVEPGIGDAELAPASG